MAKGANVSAGVVNTPAMHGGRRVVVPVDSSGPRIARIAGYSGDYDSPPNGRTVIDYTPSPGNTLTAHTFVNDFPPGPLTVFVSFEDGSVTRRLYGAGPSAL